MPLLKGSSKAVVSENIREMRNAGHPEDQAVAASLRMARESGGGKPRKKSPKKGFKPFKAVDHPHKDYRGEKMVSGEKVRV